MLNLILNQVATNLNPCRSIKTRLGWVLGATVFALSMFAGLIIAQTSSIQLEADVGQSFAELAYQMTDKLDRGIFERYHDIQILSTLEPIRNPNIPIPQKRELLQKLQSTYPDYAWIGLSDQQGKVVVATGKLLEGENVASRPWFKIAKNAPYMGDVHEAILLAKLLPNLTKEPLRFVDISVPITDTQGNYQGVLGAHLSWAWAQEVQESLLHSLWKRRQVEMFILNKKGEILLAPSKFPLSKVALANQPSVQAAMKGQKNSYSVEKWSDGKVYITGFSQSQGYRDYRGLGWLVLVRQTQKVAFVPIETLQHQLVFLSAIGGIILAGIGWLITGWIVSPILAIASAAEQIRQGNNTVKLPRLKGNDEIARLSKTLKQLIYTLQQQEQQYRTLMANFPGGAVLLFDKNLRYTLADGKGLAAIGLSKELLEGKTIWEILPSETATILEPIYREALAGGASTFEMPYASYTYLVNTLPIKNEQGEILFGMVMSQDITERKRAEFSLLQLKDDLEIKIQERTADLSDINKQLQKEISVRRLAEKQLHESQICLKLINSISTEITSSTSPFTAIESAVTKLSQYFKHLRVAYSSINSRGISTVILAIEPTGMPPLKGFVTDLKTAPEYFQDLSRKKPIIANDIAAETKLTPIADAWHEGATQAVLEVPLHHSEKLMGLLSFHSFQPYQWSPYEIATVIEIADYLSITIREAQSQQEQTRAQAALQESEERYRQLVELSPETILVHSGGKIVYINSVGIKLLGATTKVELIGKPIVDIIEPSYRVVVQERIEQLQQQEESLPLVEEQLLCLDGQIIDIEATAIATTYQGKPAVQVLIRDISERKRTLRELQQYTAQAWDLYNNAPCGYHSVDENGTFITINNTELRWLGYSKEEIIGKLKLVDLLTPQSVETFQENFPIFKERGWVNGIEFQLVCKDGSILPVLLNATAITDEAGKYASSRSTVFDITERKKAETELKDRALLLDLAHDTIMVRDVHQDIFKTGRSDQPALLQADRILFWNQGAVKMYGYSQAEALGQKAAVLLKTQFPQSSEEIEAELLRSGHWEGELIETKANGDRIIVASRWALQRDESGNPIKILEINNNITQRKQAQQELQESELLIRSLHQVATNLRLNIKERFQQVLEMGCRHFNLDFGFLASIEGNDFKVIAVQTPDNSISAGDVFDVRNSYCQETIKRGEPLCIRHASASEWANHPGYAGFGMESYIGTKIMVNNLVYGAICFASRHPCPRPFSPVDIELLKVMSQWVGSELERSKATATLEQLRHQNELILNSAGEGICGINCQGNITFINPAAAKMLGYEVNELINQPICTRLFSFKEDKTPFTLKESFLYPVLKNGIVQHFKDEKFWRKDGSSFSVECLATPMRERKSITLNSQYQATRAILDAFLPANSFMPHPVSEIVGVVITFSDITERKAIERMKDEFISVVSHELRTPLTAIRGSLGLVASGLLKTQPDKAQRMLEIAAANTDRLTRLINDILDIERIESGKIQMEKAACEVSEVIAHTIEALRVMTQNAHVTLAVSPITAKVWADRDRIIQVLTNLISNALKFSPPNTTIEISAKIVSEASLPIKQQERLNNQQPLLLVKIKDQGRGIPTDKLESIFGRFQQVNASDSRDQGGTGLGLAICRSIIQQHNGRIWAESQLGKYSTFYFTLPLLKETNPTIKPQTISASHPFPASPVVLLCDDDTSIHEAIQVSLQQRGYRVVAVASGEEAIAQASLLQPSVILLDLLMPEMDGWATMAVLKEQPRTKNIPIIIFSALVSESKSAHPDVANWLPKPLIEQSLFETIEQSLKQNTKLTRVLVVEDDPDLARVLTTMFEYHGIEVYHAATGQEAIRLSQQVHPHLLLLDVGLPDGDGFTVVEWLRLHDGLREIPLMVYSAKELSKSERDRLVLGPTQFFTKGRISPEEFEQNAIAILNRIVS